MSDPNLVTTCNFNNRDYFVKMHVTNNTLELAVSDKQTAEDWQCCYDASYIENITQKTGNFKQFNIFTAMLKSGLLKTSNCVYLDLMTFDDLDALRNHRVRGPYSVFHSTQSNNRRYLILTYTVEFDRIHYPLPLEYCGPPDPKILQQTIIKLEQEIMQLKDQIHDGKRNKFDSRAIISLQKKVDDLTEDNIQLRNETLKLTNLLDKKSKNNTYVLMLQNAIKNLEHSVMSERKSHHKLVEKLRRDKIELSKELHKARHSEKELLNRLHTTEMRPRSFKRVPFSSPSPRGDSRSPSPKVKKSESWDTQIPTKHKRLTRSSRTKFRNKCSSGSESDREFNFVKSTPSSNKPSNTKMISRPNSSSSRSSSGSRTTRKPSSRSIHEITPKRMQSKISEVDFTPVESRILSLQKMLDKGLHIT